MLLMLKLMAQLVAKELGAGDHFKPLGSRVERGGSQFDTHTAVRV
jgi:hypothetical protein